MKKPVACQGKQSTKPLVVGANPVMPLLLLKNAVTPSQSLEVNNLNLTTAVTTQSPTRHKKRVCATSLLERCTVQHDPYHIGNNPGIPHPQGESRMGEGPIRGSG